MIRTSFVKTFTDGCRLSLKRRGSIKRTKHQQNSGSNDEHALSLDEWSPVKDPAHVRNASVLANARVSTKTRSLHHFCRSFPHARVSTKTHSSTTRRCHRPRPRPRAGPSLSRSHNEPEMPSEVATKVQGPPGPRMHTPGEDGVGVGTGLMPPQMPAALLGTPQYPKNWVTTIQLLTST